MECPKCKTKMLLIQDDTIPPFGWGSFRLWGCITCNNVHFEPSKEDHPDNPLKKPYVWENENIDLSRCHISN